MADSVALLRRKVEDVSLAVQDGTMNSVITLATIEVSFPLTFSLFLFFSFRALSLPLTIETF